MKLPMKFRILTFFAQGETISDSDVFSRIKKEYGSEQQCNTSIIKNHLHSFRANCLLEDADPALDETGKLVQYYKITDLGRKRLSLLPWEYSL
ncbi:DNA-binding protein [Candidatus Formimonas warabiya]|uniref:DNA-binding protein n=1 Tax=Formimonas warabiya TaxID=1761012 RepID=A0A3G1KZZ5_FORW1|nr:DNA-binding protein [Candidatus Formimonas warabiya]ATW27959.1 hypothetical protein DCMF_27245 [Candidatus Formimonas warabiya]